MACLGEAYEALDVTTAERLEDDLYRPLQRALGRAKRTHAAFAQRSGNEAREPGAPMPGRSAQGARGYVQRTAGAAAEADHRLAELQDSMLPIESGDAELRAGLGEVRELVAPIPAAVDRFLRTLGR